MTTQKLTRASKKAETRARIAETAAQLFLAHGFSEVTIDDIAQQAGVSRRTVFRYFETKEALLFPDRDARLRFLTKALATAAAHHPHSPFHAVRTACIETAALFDGAKDRVYAQRQILAQDQRLEALDRLMDEEFEALVRRALEEEADEFTARIDAAAIVAALRAGFYWWADESPGLDMREVAENVFRALERTR